MSIDQSLIDLAAGVAVKRDRIERTHAGRVVGIVVWDDEYTGLVSILGLPVLRTTDRAMLPGGLDCVVVVR